MKTKKIISMILVLLGLILFGLGLYVNHRINQAKGAIHATSGFLPDNAIDREIRDSIDSKLGAYRIPIIVALTGGTVLVILGTGMFFRKKNH